MPSYTDIIATSTRVLREMSRVLMLVMIALASNAVRGYHLAKDAYLEYKYTTTDVHPTSRYYLTAAGHREIDGEDNVPKDCVYVEEWVNNKGTKKMLVRYEDEPVPFVWSVSPFDMGPAKCPWVWVGDRETEVDLTRTFDKFLVPGNRLTNELVSQLVKITDHTSLIYIETKTFNQVKFPGDGITIETDVDPTE